MRQYDRFKRAHPGCLLFFRMGDFYELFDDDAVTAHKALGITLTERTKGVPMAGVPFHAAEGYLRRLVEQGFRVAVCEQVQDPKEAKGVVERAVTRVVTPGTLVDDSLLDAGESNRVAAMVPATADRPGALAWAELSTGAFACAELPANELLDEVARLSPAELLLPEGTEVTPTLMASAATRAERAGWTFAPRDGGDLLRKHFGVASLTGYGLADDGPAAGAAGALLRYMLDTQASMAGDAGLRHLQPPRPVAREKFVAIDAACLRALEIERTYRSGGSEGTLLRALEQPRTAMGRRCIRQWLVQPSRDLAEIRSRHDRVAALLESDQAGADTLACLEGVQDVARIAARMSLGRATPRDLAALGRSITNASLLAQALPAGAAFEGDRAALREACVELGGLARLIADACVDEPPSHMREGGLFRDGFDAELDESRLLQRDADSWLAKYQEGLVERTGIPSLKVGYNRVFGYYIEVTNSHAARIPADFARRQTVKNAERCVTPELREFEVKVLGAERRSIDREQRLFADLCTRTAAMLPQLQSLADAVATLDTLAAFAATARALGHVRPEMTEAAVLRVTGGRHPVLERTLGRRFVANDCDLGPGDRDQTATLALITGPNMAGKSTYIRQNALIVVLAHAGAFVPAESATVGLVDRVFTRVGSGDELHLGQSTFMVEMLETARILHQASERSLVVMDEIGRGTSTLDGLSLAWSIAEQLAARGCRTLFATHYHEITSLSDRLPRVRNLHVTVREWEDGIVFLHRIEAGRADRSYGIHVAKLAGLPREAVSRAEEILESLAVHSPATTASPPPAKAAAAARQMDLFTEYLPHPVVDELRKVDLNAMTPMQAFDLLRRLSQPLKKG
ncbi:MAG: DNA mismatch repair protein MutS [Planctomycetes bacterium]|nr:DNA mismatch repair protein MutS [Planctomycetota bacterium]